MIDIRNVPPLCREITLSWRDSHDRVLDFVRYLAAELLKGRSYTTDLFSFKARTLEDMMASLQPALMQTLRDNLCLVNSNAQPNYVCALVTKLCRTIDHPLDSLCPVQVFDSCLPVVYNIGEGWKMTSVGCEDLCMPTEEVATCWSQSAARMVTAACENGRLALSNMQRDYFDLWSTNIKVTQLTHEEDWTGNITRIFGAAIEKLGSVCSWVNSTISRDVKPVVYGVPYQSAPDVYESFSCEQDGPLHPWISPQWKSDKPSDDKILSDVLIATAGVAALVGLGIGILMWRKRRTRLEEQQAQQAAAGLPAAPAGAIEMGLIQNNGNL